MSLAVLSLLPLAIQVSVITVTTYKILRTGVYAAPLLVMIDATALLSPSTP